MTADAVVGVAEADIGAISRQAVYDALGALVDKGLIRRIQPVGSPALYEDRVADNHHHLICRLCARVVDVDCAVGATPCLTAADDMGYEIDEAEVAYWGTCPDCRAEDRAATHLDPPIDRRATRRRAGRPSTSHHVAPTARRASAPAMTDSAKEDR